MAAEVETMFSARQLPWHKQGVVVSDALNSKEAIIKAGLDWTVVRRDLVDSVTGEVIPGYKANVRETDNKVLGITSDYRYQICQNIDGFEFTDKLLGEGVLYETAGSLFDGRKIWLIAKFPDREILGDTYTPYLVFTNSHDGTSGVRVAVTPVRVVCNNTLNLALNTASRSWASNHVGDIRGKLEEATNTLALTDKYLFRLNVALEVLSRMSFGDPVCERYISLLLPIKKDDGKRKIEHIKEMRNDIFTRWNTAPDLSEMPKGGYRFINAVSDFAVHTDIHRDTKNFKENLFAKVITGNGLYIDRAYDILMRAS